MNDQVIAHYCEYNPRRYSRPWVCRMTERGEFDFKVKVGTYSANHGEEGDLIVYEPVDGQVYGYGKKDYRGSNTEIHFALWDGERFILCDKLGKVIDNE